MSIELPVLGRTHVFQSFFDRGEKSGAGGTRTFGNCSLTRVVIRIDVLHGVFAELFG